MQKWAWVWIILSITWADGHQENIRVQGNNAAVCQTALDALAQKWIFQDRASVPIIEARCISGEIAPQYPDCIKGYSC